MGIQIRKLRGFNCNVRILILIAFLSVSLIESGQGQNYQIGHRQVTFTDVSRNNRKVTSEIYYPASVSEDNAPFEVGRFPLMVFAHGFLMNWNSYDIYWKTFVPQGYIMVFPTTETSISASHINYAKDIAFLAKSLKNENENSASVFYRSLTGNTAVMGHSMGGGCAFLSLQYDTTINALAILAPLKTNPSGYEEAKNIKIPVLIYSGSYDCITPPELNQRPLYDSLATKNKVWINIEGGSHCQFASSNATCSLGEIICSKSPTVSAIEQQSVVLHTLVPWLNFWVKNIHSDGVLFQNRLSENNLLKFSKQEGSLNITSVNPKNEMEIMIYPNPFIEYTTFFNQNTEPIEWIELYNLNGTLVKKTEPCPTQQIRIYRENLPAGTYFLKVYYPNKNSKVYKIEIMD